MLFQGNLQRGQVGHWLLMLWKALLPFDSDVENARSPAFDGVASKH
jgi:hypothetical protein